MRFLEREVPTATRRLSAVLWLALARLASGLARLRTGAGRAARGTWTVVDGRVRPFLLGPVKTVVIGRRTGVSAALVVGSVVAAGAVAWWVAATTGYLPLQTWAEETIAGTQPHAVVFFGVAGLVALGAVVAAVNSGIIPTAIVVAAPLFGAAITRYGTPHTEPFYGSQVVSLPQALEFAAAAVLLVGVPLAVFGFVLGELLRLGLRASDIATRLGALRAQG